MFKKLLYKNKNILITGASSGLGKNMALNYAKNGGRIINLSRDIRKMESLNEELKAIKGIKLEHPDCLVCLSYCKCS